LNPSLVLLGFVGRNPSQVVAWVHKSKLRRLHRASMFLLICYRHFHNAVGTDDVSHKPPFFIKSGVSYHAVPAWRHCFLDALGLDRGQVRVLDLPPGAVTLIVPSDKLCSCRRVDDDISPWLIDCQNSCSAVHLVARDAVGRFIFHLSRLDGG